MSTMKFPRLPGESLKTWQKRIGLARRTEHHVAQSPIIGGRWRARSMDGAYRAAKLVYDEIDRSPDSDSDDVERQEF